MDHFSAVVEPFSQLCSKRGFSPQEIRRSWQAMRCGAWSIDNLLHSWRDYVKQEGEWQAHEYQGYKPLAVDLTAIGAFETERMDG